MAAATSYNNTNNNNSTAASCDTANAIRQQQQCPRITKHRRCSNCPYHRIARVHIHRIYHRNLSHTFGNSACIQAVSHQQHDDNSRSQSDKIIRCHDGRTRSRHNGNELLEFLIKNEYTYFGQTLHNASNVNGLQSFDCMPLETRRARILMNTANGIDFGLAKGRGCV